MTPAHPAQECGWLIRTLGGASMPVAPILAGGEMRGEPACAATSPKMQNWLRAAAAVGGLAEVGGVNSGCRGRIRFAGAGTTNAFVAERSRSSARTVGGPISAGRMSGVRASGLRRCSAGQGRESLRGWGRRRARIRATRRADAFEELAALLKPLDLQRGGVHQSPAPTTAATGFGQRTSTADARKLRL